MAPTMNISVTAGQILIGWPSDSWSFGLEACTNLTEASGWFPITNAPAVIGGQNTVTLPIGVANTFYRLRQP